MISGEWRVESGEWRVESGERRERRVESDLISAFSILLISVQSFNKCSEVSGVSNSSLAESMTIVSKTNHYPLNPLTTIHYPPPLSTIH